MIEYPTPMLSPREIARWVDCAEAEKDREPRLAVLDRVTLRRRLARAVFAECRRRAAESER